MSLVRSHHINYFNLRCELLINPWRNVIYFYDTRRAFLCLNLERFNLFHSLFTSLRLISRGEWKKNKLEANDKSEFDIDGIAITRIETQCRAENDGKRENSSVMWLSSTQKACDVYTKEGSWMSFVSQRTELGSINCGNALSVSSRCRCSFINS